MQASILEFVVSTVDGECLPVPGLEVGVRYRYIDRPTSWSTAITDGDGIACFRDTHPRQPAGVDVFALGRHQHTVDPCACTHLVIEL